MPSWPHPSPISGRCWVLNSRVTSGSSKGLGDPQVVEGKEFSHANPQVHTQTHAHGHNEAWACTDTRTYIGTSVHTRACAHTLAMHAWAQAPCSKQGHRLSDPVWGRGQSPDTPFCGLTLETQPRVEKAESSELRSVPKISVPDPTSTPQAPTWGLWEDSGVIQLSLLLAETSPESSL